ncbi:indole-3-glycerol phosphate synthase TrpC [Cardiobacterium hominis]|jgi:indole-3-glycerol phosphate synthase|uniref:Indole-3-glycerol phosphate synthase n=2 Tax=Cardiobacterium hominis TaxID=2718 RepID=C8NBM6_CARH6|nr:indole-3-glycerol phosphate synthase TrpC [Cardiobacterium hominis]EEV87961.1 indole-3-glycerol phosphate synthase [Cardiobacterium hominis ATCC 15826]SAM63299.1 Indole-3-glycerol phosphate synthase [Cardiobacterium hominis]VEG77779.1 Indole-3-glycerol phosphate synthase [Cardiobacterium hominis]
MATILDDILAHKRQEVAAQKQRVDMDTLVANISASNDTPRGFMKALQARVAIGGTAVIAEVKKASPSMGVIRASFDPVAIAESYAAAGATCLSVLTDEKYFQGSGHYLRLVRAAVGLPLLRKDFIVDEYQIVEARALGADAILLIVAALSDAELAAFTRLAHDLGLDVLVEVHDEAECARALQLPLRVIGVNNRNLHDFSVSLDTSRRIKTMLPADYLLVSESGIHTRADIEALQADGIHAFLVGGALMQADDPGVALSALLAK